MDTSPKVEYQRFIQMLEAFVAGESTSRDFVNQMHGEFVACKLHEDERFFELQYALDMFGVPAKDYGYDQKMLASECRGALKLLRETR